MSETTLSLEEKVKLVEGLEELRQLTEKTVLLLRLLAHAKYEKAISQVLPSEEQRVVYAHSDGARSSRRVGETAGLPHTKVSRWWREWAEKGMGDRVSVRGPGKRFMAKYTLLALAVAVLEGQVKPD
ncbi:MAG: hypothetical protein CEE40_03650 [Chloroflexi bacterium B3_Chlor]|nr:MAG: hypothetical protein CEE40_03650 [Chloroflexi bacterium B3_Chlor]